MSVTIHGSFQTHPEKGAYIMRDPHETAEILLIGSEIPDSVLFSIANELSVRGITARIVSASDINLFLRQDNEYRSAILPPEIQIKIGVIHCSSERESMGTICTAVFPDSIGISRIVKEILFIHERNKEESEESELNLRPEYC